MFYRNFIFFLFVLYSTSSVYSLTQESSVHETSYARYIFLSDQEGQRWIYKQIIDSTPDNQISLVLETYASKIALALNIPINEVITIPGDIPFRHRFFDNFPGSLHRVVPGKSVEDESPWEDFDIHQKMRSPFMIAKLGPLLREEEGLRKEIIQTMSRHVDLPKIVALDTFLGNNDRSNPNIFYDSETKSFYGIDMGNCFKGNLAKVANQKIQEFTYTQEEKAGLIKYRNMLLSLVEAFPPEISKSLLNSCLQEAGFIPSNSLLWDEDVERMVNRWKKNIEENYVDAIKLLESLRKVL